MRRWVRRDAGQHLLRRQDGGLSIVQTPSLAPTSHGVDGQEDRLLVVERSLAYLTLSIDSPNRVSSSWPLSLRELLRISLLIHGSDQAIGTRTNPLDEGIVDTKVLVGHSSGRCSARTRAVARQGRRVNFRAMRSSTSSSRGF